MVNPSEFFQRSLTLFTNQIHTLPIVTLMPHSACNCRCVMCDIWKANRNKQEISEETLANHIKTFRKLKVKWVVFSGGEALMHSNLWTLCEMLNELNIKITILSTGLLLKKYAREVVKWSDEVIVSLDGSAEIHNKIRNIPDAFEKLELGVNALRDNSPDFRVSGRCVLQRLNYFDLPNIIESAIHLDLNQISFLAADVSTTAFNRVQEWDSERISDVALTSSEVDEFSQIIERSIEKYSDQFASRFIAESPDKIRKIALYYSTLNGDNDFPYVRCNAPWVSTVIEADGIVRPCFFHQSLGNIHDKPLLEIINSSEARNFRKKLDISKDPICRKCVCSLNINPINPII